MGDAPGRYLPRFYRVEQGATAALVIRGRLGGLQRKTSEPIAIEAGQPRKPVQFFVGSGKRDDEAVMAEGAKRPGGRPGGSFARVEPMEPIRVHHGAGRRHLGDLTPERPGAVAGRGVAAPAASRRPAPVDLTDGLGRDQGRRVSEGGSEGGGREELVGFLPGRCSSSAVRRR